MDSQQQHVYIVDGDPVYLESLTLRVRSLGFEVRAFSDGEQFLQALDKTINSCAMVDLNMPSLDGLALLDKLAEDPLAPPVIMITAHANVPAAVRAMRTGAIAFLQKQVLSDSALWESLQLALARHADARARHMRAEGVRQRLATLTAGERQVLELLVRGHDHTKIATLLGVSRRTVENRRSKLMRKLEVANFPQLVLLAVRAGLLDGETSVGESP